MKPAPPITVLVHPHYFDTYHGYRFGKNPIPETGIRISPAMRKVAAGNKEALAHVTQLTALALRYRKEIRRVAATPGARLFLLKDQLGYSSLEITGMKKQGISEHTAEGIRQIGRGLQDSLEAYAQKRLGDRFTATITEPKKIAQWAVTQGHLTKADRRKEIHVFGEELSACVRWAGTSLWRRGFSNVRIHKGKSVSRMKNAVWE